VDHLAGCPALSSGPSLRCWRNWAAHHWDVGGGAPRAAVCSRLQPRLMMRVLLGSCANGWGEGFARVGPCGLLGVLCMHCCSHFAPAWSDGDGRGLRMDCWRRTSDVDGLAGQGCLLRRPSTALSTRENPWSYRGGQCATMAMHPFAPPGGCCGPCHRPSPPCTRRSKEGSSAPLPAPGTEAGREEPVRRLVAYCVARRVIGQTPDVGGYGDGTRTAQPRARPPPSATTTRALAGAAAAHPACS
jgi:hypothetical protein